MLHLAVCDLLDPPEGAGPGVLVEGGGGAHHRGGPAARGRPGEPVALALLHVALVVKDLLGASSRPVLGVVHEL